MALATLADLAAIGAVPVDVDTESPEGVRAARLLELASGQVLTFLDGFTVTEAAIGEWDQFRQDALSAVVAEIASKRLTVSAAASVDPYGLPAAPQTMKLNRWEKRAIIEILPVVDGEGENTVAGDWWEP